MKTDSFNTFISYRRTGGSDYAGRLYDYLDEKGFSTFYDITGMEAGRFDEQLRLRIINAKNFISLLSLNALDRCCNDDDWVKKEISLAIKSNINIIVLIEEGFEFPEELPEEIKDVVKFQSLEFNKNNIKYKFRELLTMLLKEESDFSLFDPYESQKKVRLKGVYLTKYEDDENGRRVIRKAQANLKSFGRRVYGTTTFGSKQEWVLQGKLYGKKQIAGIYHAKSALDNGIGTFFLERKSPTVFDGFWSGYDNANNKITSGRYQFRKKYDNFTISETTADPRAISGIIKISNKQLGEKYVTEEILEHIIDPATTTCCVTVTDNFTNEVIGFCIYDILTYPQVKEITKKNVPELKFANKVGYIKTIAVCEKFNGLGIGSSLIKDVMERLYKKGIKQFFSSAWKHAGKINIENLLKNEGFFKWEEIPDYWYEASIREGFSCPQCGNPCHCSCVFYLKI